MAINNEENYKIDPENISNYIVWFHNDVNAHVENLIKNGLGIDVEFASFKSNGDLVEMKKLPLLNRPDVLVCQDGTKLPIEVKQALESSGCKIAYATSKPRERITQSFQNEVFELTSEEITTDVIKGENVVEKKQTKKDFACEKILEMCQLSNVSKLYKIIEKDSKKTLASVDVGKKIEEGNSLESINKEYLKKLADTMNVYINRKDGYTFGHCQRVAQYTKILGEALGFSKDKIDDMVISAKLHDIGKIAVPQQVITKTSGLNDLEFSAMKSHTNLGADLIPEIKGTNIYGGIRNHHEKYNGAGYPDGLKGDEIPEFAQVIAIADSFDAMTSQRSYNKVKTADEAFEDLINHKGTWYNPTMVDAFVNQMKKCPDILEQLNQAKINADQNILEMNEKERIKMETDKQFTKNLGKRS